MDVSVERLLCRLVKEFENVNSLFPLSPGKVAELKDIVNQAKYLIHSDEDGFGSD